MFRSLEDQVYARLWSGEMAPHSSVLAWSIPGTGEPGGLPSVGSHSVGHDGGDLQQQPLEWGPRALLLRVTVGPHCMAAPGVGAP